MMRTALQEQGTTPVYAHLSEVVDDVLALGLEPGGVLVIGRLVLVEKAAPTPPEPRASRDIGPSEPAAEGWRG